MGRLVLRPGQGRGGGVLVKLRVMHVDGVLRDHDLPEDTRAALACDIRDPALQRRIIAHWKDPKGIGEDRLPWLVVS